MSQGQYVATRPFPTTHRQYEIGDMIDTSRITSSELNAGVTSGAIEPAKFIDTAARLAALNPVLGPGVHAYETDTGVHKIGTDGVTRYNSLGQVGNGTYARFRAAPTVALLGDSISDQNGPITSATAPTYSGRGYFTHANSITRWAFTWITASATDIAFGQSGETAANMIAMGDVALAAASSADIIVVHAGTNDLGQSVPAATVAADLLTIWRTLVAAGKTVIATTVIPRNNSDSAGITQALRDTNRLIRANAAVTKGVLLCDWAPVMLNASTGLANSAYLVDGVHPNAIGAGRMGAELAKVLALLHPTTLSGPVCIDNTDTKDLLTNGLMTGTGGATGTGPTGTVATGWTVYRDGTPTSVTCSKVARTDLYPGEWQQVVNVAATANTDGSHAEAYNSNVGTDWAIGDTVYMTTEFETDASGWDGRALYATLFCQTSSAAAQSCSQTLAERTALTGPLTRQPSGVLVTPPIVIPASTTMLKADLYFWGSGTVRWGRTQIVKV